MGFRSWKAWATIRKEWWAIMQKPKPWPPKRPSALPSEAWKWFERGAQQGDPLSLYTVGLRQISAAEDRGKIWRQFLSGSLDTNPDAYRLASPLQHLDANDPPIAIMGGEKDDPSTRADAFRKKMTELGVPSHLKVIEGAPHGFLNRQSWFDQYIDYAASFFTVHLKHTN